jgi:xylulokinase
MSLLGLDIGTTGCKAVAFDLSGRILASHYREYPLSFPAPDRCELDTEIVWGAIIEVIRASARAVSDHDPVVAMGISALGDAVTPVDEGGQALAPSIVGSLDRRAVPQAKWIDDHIGRDEVFQLTGVPPHAMCAVPKIMWLRRFNADIYHRAWKFVSWQELLQIRLGLAPAVDYSQACRSMAVDLHTRAYAGDLLKGCGLTEDMFCPLVESTQVIGQLDAAHAWPLGLTAGVKVVAGGFDQACAALGRGVFEPGAAALSMGTVELITAVADGIRLEASLLEGNHGCGFHVIPDRYISLAYIITAGAILRWYRDTLGLPERNSAAQQGRDPYDVMIEAVPDRPAQVFVLPYFAGTGTPWNDPRQKGAISGLTLATDRPEIVKGILDSLCYELRINLDSLAASGFDVGRLYATGGGARSDRWMQLKADITGVPIETAQDMEAGALGAAFLAGLGTGIYGRPDQILEMIKTANEFKPRPEQAEAYKAPFEHYRELRRRAEGIYR